MTETTLRIELNETEIAVRERVYRAERAGEGVELSADEVAALWMSVLVTSRAQIRRNDMLAADNKRLRQAHRDVARSLRRMADTAIEEAMA